MIGLSEKQIVLALERNNRFRLVIDGLETDKIIGAIVYDFIHVNPVDNNILIFKEDKIIGSLVLENIAKYKELDEDGIVELYITD